MGFATGFRTGLEAGGAGRSNMPIIQGLGSMIGQLAERNKRGSVRFAGGKGPSSYDKYVARKDQEEAAAEEKRRYEAGQVAQREEMATQQQAAAVQAEQAQAQEGRAAEAHESQMQSQQAQREQAASMFERSKKKEARVEAYRGLLQGAASRNKALTEASWAALTPDMPEEEAKEWAPYKEEMVEETDPQTGKVTQHRKFTVGRDKAGQESPNALPGPAVTYNADDSVTVEYPGEDEPKTYANDEEFKQSLALFHPEAESSKSLDEKEKKRKVERAEEKHETAMAKASRDEIMDEQKRLDTDKEQGRVKPEEVKERQKAINEMWASYKKGKKGKQYKTAKVVDPEGKEMLAYADEKKPQGKYPGKLKRDENGAWNYVDPKNPGVKVYFNPPKK